MSRPRRRIRRNTKTLDSLRAGAIIISLLLGCILIAWLATQLLRQKEPSPDLAPQHDRSMWETPADRR